MKYNEEIEQLEFFKGMVQQKMVQEELERERVTNERDDLLYQGH